MYEFCKQTPFKMAAIGTLSLMKIAETLSKGYKTLWEKEKLLVNEQFLLFPQCFQKTCTADT